jgi:pantoate--beta-alanine ligase
MQVISSIADFRKARSDLRGTLGFVPTMGYLHEGHLALVRRGRLENDVLATSIFVNPSQFGPSEDFRAYPRDMEKDLAILGGEGVDLVFAPLAEDIYPPGFDTWIVVGSLSERLEGEHRPGHFRGVATVVAKLLNIVRPDRAYFGQKDGQQVAVTKRMVADLDMGIDIVVVPTVRDTDGLALSSRNVYLTTEQRRVAPVIYKALCQARKLWEEGERSGESLRSRVRRTLEQEPLIEKIDYVSVADASSLEEMDSIRQPVMVSVAVHVGRTRLIDNVLLG